MSEIPFKQLYDDVLNYAPVTTDQWQEFASTLSLRKFKKKEVFLRAGDDPSQFGILVEGVFRLYFVRPDGKEFTKIFRRPYDLVGCLAELELKIPSRLFAEAVTPATMLVGNATEFDKMCDKYKEWERVARKVALKSYVDKEQREFEFLQLSALERYELFKERYSEIAGIIPNYQIASYLGITPVAFSRMLSTKN